MAVYSKFFTGEYSTSASRQQVEHSPSKNERHGHT